MATKEEKTKATRRSVYLREQDLRELKSAMPWLMAEAAEGSDRESASAVFRWALRQIRKARMKKLSAKDVERLIDSA